MTELKAPYPASRVTVILPNPQFNDSRSSESVVTAKRSMLGRVITYIKQSDRTILRLPFQLSRMKALELQAFLNSYQSATVEVVLYDGSRWAAQFIGEPHAQTAIDRLSDQTLTGKELVEVTLTLSAKRLN